MTDNTDLIQLALEQLDPANDDHWTADGLPRVDVVKELSGLEELSRADITTAAPEFSRSAAPEEGPAAGTPNLDAEGHAPEEPQETPEISEDDDLSELQRELKAAEAELEKATAAVRAATEARNAVRAKVDEIRERAAQEQAAVPLGVHIRAYLNSQVAEKQRRAEEAYRLQQLNRELSAPSALDAAMAHKRGHGQSRPAPRKPRS